jgi:hypothetical protein
MRECVRRVKSEAHCRVLCVLPRAICAHQITLSIAHATAHSIIWPTRFVVCSTISVVIVLLQDKFALFVKCMIVAQCVCVQANSMLINEKLLKVFDIGNAKTASAPTLRFVLA